MEPARRWGPPSRCSASSRDWEPQEVSLDHHNTGPADRRDRATSARLDLALRYAARGLHVLPCNAQKRPLIKDWPSRATTDKNQIIEWWTQWPEAVIGCVPGRSGHIVVDLDNKNGSGNGNEFFTQLASLDPLGTSVIASTPHKGRHLWYRFPEGRRYGSSNNKRIGVDVRSLDGYVLLPSGNDSREWIEDSILDVEPGEVPEWLVPWLDGEVGPAKGAGAPRTYGKMSPAGTATDLRFDEVESALLAIPATVGRELWLPLIYAVHDALEGDERGADLVERWSAQAEPYDKRKGTGQYKKDEAYRIYGSTADAIVVRRSGREPVTAATLFEMAHRRDWKWQLPVEDEPDVGAVEDHVGEQPVGGEGADQDAKDGAAEPADADPHMEQAAERKRPKRPKPGTRHGGRLVLDPSKTMPTAEAFVRERYMHEEGRTLHCYAELFLEWRDGRWREKEHGTVRHELQPWLHDAWTVRPRTDEPGVWRLEWSQFDSNSSTIRGAQVAIEDLTHVEAMTAMPSWIGDAADEPPAIEILPCRTTLLHIPTRRRRPATPRFFTTNGIDFDYEPEAPRPERWLTFLGELFGDDLEAVELLKEFLGYVLTLDTSQQKALLIVGPKRSGKGTIARVLTELVGRGNVCAPTVTGLAGPFGLQPLIGKSLAIVSDARFHGEGIPAVVERLLCITGEDTITIDRKHVSSVSMKLPTRFVFLTNELPRFTDASSALASRFLILNLKRSFFGKEDVQLTDKLLGELPGILHWALEGWQRLRERGRFHVPASSREQADELDRLSSPVGAFVNDCCEVGGSYRTTIGDLFFAWQQWCRREGREHPGTRQSFCRDLKTAVPGLERRRGTANEGFYEGIRLLPDGTWRSG